MYGLDSPLPWSSSTAHRQQLGQPLVLSNNNTTPSTSYNSNSKHSAARTPSSASTTNATSAGKKLSLYCMFLCQLLQSIELYRKYVRFVSFAPSRCTMQAGMPYAYSLMSYSCCTLHSSTSTAFASTCTINPSPLVAGNTFNWLYLYLPL